MNMREAERFDSGNIPGGMPGNIIATCSFDFNRELAGVLVDMSMKGFGIEIRAISGSLLEDIQANENYMMTIDFGEEKILAAVKNVWNVVLFEDGVMIFKGGVSIDVMSPGDRIILSRIIERMRCGR